MSWSALISTTQAILNNLIPLAVEQIKGAGGFKEDLRMLVQRLKTIQRYLLDVENKITTSTDLQKWLKSVKDVIACAEDVVDEFAYETIQRKKKMQNRMMNKVHNFFSISNPLAFRLKMISKVKNINLLLDNICQELHNIHLRTRVFNPTHPFVDDFEVVGRDRDVSTVINILLESKIEHVLPVIAIVGMPGLGKTTLAQLVYKNNKIVENFGDQRIWIHVSINFEVERLLNKMVQSLNGCKYYSSTIDEIVRQLRKRLGGRKYLLVLDDVWNEVPAIWESLREYLMEIEGLEGSKILITTRNTQVASTMATSSSCTYMLNKLSDDDCWTIFSKRIFSSGGTVEAPNLVDIGRRMIEKCRGVPLAISSLGGLLYSKKDEHEWTLIENSELWCLPGGKNGMLPALMLSFDHLPSPFLKQCFAICALFPKDFDIKKDKLIQLWASLGYLESHSEWELEIDVGNDYFNTLLRRSLLQSVELDEYNNITSCKMHDLVHDLALDVSKGTCLKLACNEVNDQPEVQHLSLHFVEETTSKSLEEVAWKLRTLFLNGNMPENIENVKCVRAFSWKQLKAGSLPSSISQFTHLKYLDLSETSIRTLPNFITKLYHLQTLRLPRDLKKLPKDFLKLVSLRNLCIYDTPENRKLMPSNIGKLTSLQTLPFFVVGEDRGHKIKELGSLKNLRGRLNIYNLQHVKDKKEAETAKLLEKAYIQELGLHWNDNFGDSEVNHHEDVLEGLKPPCDLRCLIIENYGGRSFASWMMDTQLVENLVRFELKYCIRCKEIPPLVQFPHLEVVKMVGLRELERICPNIHGLTAFPALRELTLIDMPWLKDWFGTLLRDLPSFKVVNIKGPRIYDYAYFDIQTKYSPCLNIESQHNLDISSSNFWENLLEKNSESLRILRVENLEDLVNFPDKLKGLSLEELHISACPNLVSIFILEGRPFSDRVYLYNAPIRASLKKVSILNCPKLGFFPWALQTETLVELRVDSCDNLRAESYEPGLHYGKRADRFKSLQKLSIWHCPMIGLPQKFLAQTLVELEIVSCRYLKIDSPSEKPSLDMPSLKSLKLLNCPALGYYFALGATSLRVLKTDAISEGVGREIETNYPHHLRSLHSLTTDGRLIDYLPQLTTLKKLSIRNVKGLEALPEWLGKLSSLQSLKLHRCHDLSSFPSWESMRDLTNLQSLKIVDCPLLVKRCDRKRGEEWHKIAGIPSIQIHTT